MLYLLTENTLTTRTPTSGDFWNPTNWAPLVERVGIPGFFALVLFAFFIAFLWRGLTKWDRHLTRQERLTASQLNICRQVHGTGGVANVSDLRDAGHDFADALQGIADGIDNNIGKAIKPRIERIHEKLRNSPPPLPATVNGD